LVLVRTRNPLNIGAVARAMSNFGFSCLRVVQPYEPAFREARSAVGAASLLQRARQHTSVADAVADCSLVVGTTAIGERRLQQPIRDLGPATKLIRKRLSSHRVAVLFGSEKTGLSNEELSYCHWLLHIPTRKQHLSMNLGQAVAIVLYALSASNAPKVLERAPNPATADDLERLTTALRAAATASGFKKAQSVESSEQRLRRLVRRLSLRSEDAGVLLGIMRRILWKLNTQSGD
jgi:TrmH family RNA methyltransferase